MGLVCIFFSFFFVLFVVFFSFFLFLADNGKRFIVKWQLGHPMS